MKKIRATRHNGRSGKAGHNDRSFNVENARHIEEERCSKNVYWDCYQGFNIADENGTRPDREMSFDDVELKFYEERFTDSVNAQNERHKQSRHTERIRNVKDVLKDSKTCPEETIFQLGTKDGHEDPKLFVEVVKELIDTMEEFYGANFKTLNWALHMDESTPHIHERHVFFANDGYGMYFPKQDKALEALGFERPEPDKKQGKFNNRKMSFDAEVRQLYIEIAQKHGVIIERVPLEGKEHLEKNDYILARQHEEIQTNENTISEQMLRISDVNKLIDDVSNDAYTLACEVVTERVKEETQDADMKILGDVEEKIMRSDNTPQTKKIVKSVFKIIRDRFNKARENLIGTIKEKLLYNKEEKDRNVEVIKERAREGIKEKLARAKDRSKSHEPLREGRKIYNQNMKGRSKDENRQSL